MTFRVDGQRRYTLTRWRRKRALEESWALRYLVRAHGHLPACAPTVWEESE